MQRVQQKGKQIEAHLVLNVQILARLLDDFGREALRLGGSHHLQRKYRTGQRVGRHGYEDPQSAASDETAGWAGTFDCVINYLINKHQRAGTVDCPSPGSGQTQRPETQAIPNQA